MTTECTPPTDHAYILSVEDSPIDFEIIMRSLKKAGFEAPIHHCENGDSALDFLFAQKAKGHAACLPTIVLLDLNLPGTDGREVLRTIKSDDVLKSIPVVILSTSNNDNDVEYCLSHGADKYFMKPISPDNFVHTIHEIKILWDQMISHS